MSQAPSHQALCNLARAGASWAWRRHKAQAERSAVPFKLAGATGSGGGSAVPLASWAPAGILARLEPRVGNLNLKMLRLVRVIVCRTYSYNTDCKVFV